VTSDKPGMGEQLIAAGLLTPDNLALGLDLQKATGGSLLDVLIAHQLVDERKALRLFAEQKGVRYITFDKLAKANIAQDVLDKIPARHAEKLGVLPLAYQGAGNVLTVAFSEVEPGLVEQVRLASGAGVVSPIIASRAAVVAGIKRFYFGDTYSFAQMEAGVASAVLTKEPEQEPPRVVARESSRVGPAPEGPPSEDLERLKREVSLLRLVTELNRHLSRERDPTAILMRVLAFAFDNLPADDGVLVLRDPATGALKPRGARTRSGDEDAQVAVSETLIKEVVETRQGVLTADAVTDARFNRSESVVAVGLRSAMGVPLTVGTCSSSARGSG